MDDFHPDVDDLTLVKFKDFVPAQKAYNLWTGVGEYEPLTNALQDLNAWIMANPEMEILNVETVVLPNLHDKREEGSEDPETRTPGPMGYNHWHQFLRLWYLNRTLDSHL